MFDMGLQFSKSIKSGEVEVKSEAPEPVKENDNSVM